jgi:hypothetical protein
LQEIFLNFGAPLIGALGLMCCCGLTRWLKPDLPRFFLPFGLHERAAVVGLGLDETVLEHKKERKKEKTAREIKTEIEDTNHVSRHLKEAMAKREKFREWNLRLTINEAQFLPVCDVAIRDAKMVGLADPYGIFNLP